MLQIRKTVALMLVIGATAGAAHASDIYTVDAEYDQFISQDTDITVHNLSGSDLTNVSISAGGLTETMFLDLAPNATAQFAFPTSAPTPSPFEPDAGNTGGVPDSTVYTVTATYQGKSLASNGFSEISNLSGVYVDFLGECASGDTVDCTYPGADLPTLSGQVAAAASPVPLPGALVLFVSSLFGFAGLRRRA